MSAPRSLLDVRDLGKAYGDVAVLDGVTFTVEPAEVVALTGPNGSGKSTLLKCIAGWEEPTTGVVLFDGGPYAEQLPCVRAALAGGALGNQLLEQIQTVDAVLVGDGHGGLLAGGGRLHHTTGSVVSRASNRLKPTARSLP